MLRVSESPGLRNIPDMKGGVRLCVPKTQKHIQQIVLAQQTSYFVRFVTEFWLTIVIKRCGPLHVFFLICRHVLYHRTVLSPKSNLPIF